MGGRWTLQGEGLSQRMRVQLALIRAVIVLWSRRGAGSGALQGGQENGEEGVSRC